MTRLPTPGKNTTSHVTVRCNNKEFLFGLAENINDLVSWTNSLTVMYEIDIHHMIYMSNHMHILMTPNHDNMGQAMSYFLTNLSKYLNYKLNRNDHIFGRRYRATVIESSRHFINVIRYIYQNPVRAGMVNQIEHYPYSSLGFYLGNNNLGIKLKPDSFTQNIINQGVEEWLAWIKSIKNPLLENDVAILRHSLDRRKFGFSISQLRSAESNGTKLII